MKIAILSDFHFGFAAGTEREEDPYDAVREAVDRAMDCDLIILGGDIFDNRNPNAEVLTKAMEILVKPLLKKSETRLVKGVGKDISKVSKMSLLGIPVVAIHGTHERRTKGLLNPVQALERAGFLIHLHCNSVVFEKNGEKVAVHGMSGVPDQYAESVLKNWNPKPIEGCFNIFILHQSISEFLYAQYTMDLKNLPRGFDLYVDGHIHEAKKTAYDGKPFLLTGSVIATQLKEESTKPKGFWTFETSTSETRWNVIENQRKVYYKTFEDPDMETIEKELAGILKEKQNKKPIVRMNLKGKVRNTLMNEIENKFGGNLLISFKKEVDEKGRLPTKTLEEHKLSVEEMGRKLLLENLEKSGLDIRTFENLFELLVEGKLSEGMETLMKASLTGKPKPAAKRIKTKPGKKISGALKKPLKPPKQTTLFGKRGKSN